MLNRRQFLAKSIQSSSLLACATAVPSFLASSAFATDAAKDTILVVLELDGGNDGLNTIIPHSDDLYHRARPTLGLKKSATFPFTDRLGFHSSLSALQPLHAQGQVAAVLGVGYPNPDRSHFESMDIWQSGDVTRSSDTGWLGRGLPKLHDAGGSIPALQVGAEDLPLALAGAAGAAISLNPKAPFRLETGHGDRRDPRRQLVESLAKDPQPSDDLLSFVRRRQVQTYTTFDKLREVLDATNAKANEAGNSLGESLAGKMDLVARLINQGFGTRIYYMSLDGFDTHSRQANDHPGLLTDIGTGIAHLFQQLKAGNNADRVVLMTFSEFGRRVKENGSRGTDHGAGSCMFLAGPAVRGGPIGEHPKLDDLDSGDLRGPTDFRRVYATLLDQWLGVNSRGVLGAEFAHLPILKKGAKS